MSLICPTCLTRSLSKIAQEVSWCDNCGTAISAGNILVSECWTLRLQYLTVQNKYTGNRQSLVDALRKDI